MHPVKNARERPEKDIDADDNSGRDRKRCLICAAYTEFKEFAAKQRIDEDPWKESKREGKQDRYAQDPRQNQEPGDRPDEQIESRSTKAIFEPRRHL
jgi:hypothetical protein